MILVERLIAVAKSLEHCAIFLEHMFQQPELIPMGILCLIENDKRETVPQPLSENRVLTERTPGKRSHVSISIETSLDHRGLKLGKSLSTIGIPAMLAFLSPHQQALGLNATVVKVWIEIKMSDPLLHGRRRTASLLL
ncbi:hypothetical protein D9M69_422820 [compost metagenome]